MLRLQKSPVALLLMMIILGSYSFAQAEDLSGAWTKKGQRIAGSWSIEAREDGHYLVLDEEFRTRKAPDLKFVLSKQPLADANNRNAMVDALVIAPLKSNRGGQSYKLPDNYGDYASLLLHCEQYSKLWGGTTI